MRETIMAFLDEAQRAHEQEAIHPDLTNPVKGRDYTYTLSEDQKSRLQGLYDRITQLTTCLVASNKIKDVHPGTTNSIYVVVSSDTDASVVIECSLYAPLVALFSYGNVPSLVMQHIIQCVHTLGLIDLTQDEIQVLEREDMWRTLF